MEKIFYCQGEETEHIKYGDVFTIIADKSAKNWGMVVDGGKPKKFRLVPPTRSDKVKVEK